MEKLWERVPIDACSLYSAPMRQRLTDGQIEILCREVLTRESAPSGRSLRRALRARFGAAGRTDRVYAIWRRLSRGVAGDAGDAGAGSGSPVTDAERQRWRARIAAAEERARLAEERETVHQDRWANEVYELREQLRSRQGRVVSGVSHEMYRRVHQELLEAQAEVARLKAGGTMDQP